MSSVAEDKWVRIMCDHCADGVWTRDGAAESADELPISAALRDRIRAWQEWHDRDNNDCVPPDDPEFSELPPAFSVEGLEIARAVKAELPDWAVIYFDEHAARWGQEPRPPRREYEYEITASAIEARKGGDAPAAPRGARERGPEGETP